MSGFTEDENAADIQKRANGVAKREEDQHAAIRWSGLKAAKTRGLSGDYMEEGREQPASQDRSALDIVFP
ncbi:AbrB/MazE/SpoVT family DNA-binding domain-containing protein [Rhizobium pusense]|uniref:AbrB/MazE/SpoVT family DNA-binding domain-containing protein n=1 Tax=Agrobacterium pusense TaxID=648995 RepID=A0A6H0ZQG5_9HYPH|nr:AbrB/MazE/SpoVT family DNA-binding domain-containing protein [Agrobacterium pusense]MDH2089124.1 AbrB/MazE/SpoVT family DNA-binding domain-containing protein [Agrobacterium pusense]QIX23092.1 AbrB/MazE/SpoVT family DNA-binding domain-containing protein [Agrobacterium pusense]WCK27332.1 AbrB/MazE/SpoVT family DNA-binding domain-containing protein [Agrobacterium pusense]